MPDGLGIPETKVPAVSITTEAQAVSYVTDLVDKMLRLRAGCDVSYTPKGPNDPTVKAIQRMMWTFLQTQGQVVGALNAFRLAGLMPERAYVEMHQQAINSLIPTVVGRA